MQFGTTPKRSSGGPDPAADLPPVVLSSLVSLNPDGLGKPLRIANRSKRDSGSRRKFTQSFQIFPYWWFSDVRW